MPDDTKKELVRGLTEIFGKNMCAIILFGSVARGDAVDESDIDIAVIIKKEMDIQTKRHFISWVADMDIRYEKVFSIVDIQKKKYKEMGKCSSILSEYSEGGDCSMEGSLKELAGYRYGTA